MSLYLGAYPLFKLGIMPYDGGWLNQSQKYLDAMTTIDNEVKAMEFENARKQ